MHLYKTQCITIILFLSFLNAWSQNSQTDSLLTVINTTQNDSVWFASVDKLFDKKLSEGEVAESGKLANQFYTKAQQLQDTSQIIKACFAYANYFKKINQYDSASYYALKANQLAIVLQNLDFISYSYIELGRLNFVQGNYEASLQLCLKALEILEKNKVGDAARLYGQMATTYSYMNNQKEAQKYFKLGIEILEKPNNANFKWLSSMYVNLGASYFFQGDYNMAIEYYKKGLDIDLKHNQKDEISINFINIGEAFGYLYQYDSALYNLQKGLDYAKTFNDAYVESSALLMLSDVYGKMGQTKESFDYYKSYISLKDSIFSVEKSKEIAKMEVLYETEKQQNQILQLEKNQQLAGLELEKQRNRNSFFGASSVFFLLISGAFIIGFVQVKKAKAEVDRRNALITEINEELNASQEALMLSNRTKDKFFAIIAHDLRGPITSLSGIGKLLNFNLQKGRQEKVEELITQLDRSSNQVNHLLDNLLKWALAQTGALNFNPVVVNINSVIQDSVAIFQESANAKGIKILLDGDIQENVLADNNMLSTIFRNLIGNAIKFTPLEGDVKLSVNKEEDKVKISISDTGVGIPQHLIDKINNFESLPSTVGTQGEKGTGLGLMLCQEFVKMQGSKLKIQSSNGQGTKISFHLSLA